MTDSGSKAAWKSFFCCRSACGSAPACGSKGLI